MLYTSQTIGFGPEEYAAQALRALANPVGQIPQGVPRRRDQR